MQIKKEKISESELKRQIQDKDQQLIESQKEKMELENGYKQQFAKLAHENAVLKQENRALQQQQRQQDEMTLPLPQKTELVPNPEHLVTKNELENYLDKRLKDLEPSKRQGW